MNEQEIRVDQTRKVLEWIVDSWTFEYVYMEEIVSDWNRDHPDCQIQIGE